MNILELELYAFTCYIIAASSTAKMTTVTWGIAGTGRICNDFVLALQTLDKKSHVIKAVVGRDLQKANDFAKAHNLDEFSNDFDFLAKHKEINVVYIGVVNTEHFRIAKLALENGKNVLCEKPMCLNAKQTEELIKIARENKRFLMEAVWSRFFPVYKEIKQQISAGEIGEIFQVNANLGFPITNITRLTSHELGGGSVLDLGIYVLQFAQFIFPGLKPIDIQAVGNLNEGGVDLDAGILIKFPGGKNAVLSCNAKVVMSNIGEIFGEKGIITVPNFWCPSSVKGPSGEKQFPLPESSGSFNFFNSVGLSYEAEEVRRCLSEGLLESPGMSLDESLILAEWRDIAHTKLGRAD